MRTDQLLPDCCLKQNRCAREHGNSPCLDMFATSTELSLILLMQIKMVTHECNLGCHLIDCQSAVVAHKGVAIACQDVIIDHQGAAINHQGVVPSGCSRRLSWCSHRPSGCHRRPSGCSHHSSGCHRPPSGYNHCSSGCHHRPSCSSCTSCDATNSPYK
jgi:hypothetical protein